MGDMEEGNRERKWTQEQKKRSKGKVLMWRRVISIGRTKESYRKAIIVKERKEIKIWKRWRKWKEEYLFKFLTAMIMRSTVVWHVMPCSPVEVHCQRNLPPPSSRSKITRSKYPARKRWQAGCRWKDSAEKMGEDWRLMIAQNYKF